MKLDLDNPNVFEASMSVDQVRNIEGVDATLPDEIYTQLDLAQGYVHSNEGDKAYLVITIS